MIRGLFIGVAMLLLVPSVTQPGGAASAPAESLTFVKILLDGPAAGSSRSARIECFKPAGPDSTDELCIDWRASIRLSFDRIESVLVERQEMPRELENIGRRMKGLPDLPVTDRTVSYHTMLTIELPKESAKAYQDFVRPHAGALFDMRIGTERVAAVVLGKQRVTTTIRVRFAQDLTERLRALFAPLGNRLVIRERP